VDFCQSRVPRADRSPASVIGLAIADGLRRIDKAGTPREEALVLED
jgi:hypothetical protein